MRVRLKELLSLAIVMLVLSPLTAPFSTYDVSGRHDITAPQTDPLAAKTCVDDTALLGVGTTAPVVAPVYVNLAPVVSPDESSKHQIPSRILRL